MYATMLSIPKWPDTPPIQHRTTPQYTSRDTDQAPRRDLKVSDPTVRDQTLAELGLAPASVLLLRFEGEAGEAFNRKWPSLLFSPFLVSVVWKEGFAACLFLSGRKFRRRDEMQCGLSPFLG